MYGQIIWTARRAYLTRLVLALFPAGGKRIVVKVTCNDEGACDCENVLAAKAKGGFHS